MCIMQGGKDPTSNGWITKVHLDMHDRFVYENSLGNLIYEYPSSFSSICHYHIERLLPMLECFSPALAKQYPLLFHRGISAVVSLLRHEKATRIVREFYRYFEEFARRKIEIKPLSLFVSYNDDDSKTDATNFASQMKNLGMQVWLDQNELKLGRKWMEEVREALFQADIAIVLVGPRGVGNSQQREIELAIKIARRSSLKILPVTLLGATFLFPSALNEWTRIPFPNLTNQDDVVKFAGKLQNLVR